MNEPFLSINEVSKQLDIPAHTLRNWEKQFPVSIKPTTGTGGRRYYRAETIANLEKIRALLYDNGMTIAGVKKIIKDGGLNQEIIAKEQPVVKNQTTSSSAQTIFAQPQTIPSIAPNLGGAQAVMDATCEKVDLESTADISRAIELLELAKAELN